MDGVKYIDVRKEDGEVIASIPIDSKDDEIIVKNGYTVVFGYGEALYEDVDDKIYAIEKDTDVETKVKE